MRDAGTYGGYGGGYLQLRPRPISEGTEFHPRSDEMRGERLWFPSSMRPKSCGRNTRCAPGLDREHGDDA